MCKLTTKEQTVLLASLKSRIDANMFVPMSKIRNLVVDALYDSGLHDDKVSNFGR
ncbi:MAG: hypothetical protein R8M45_04305 [Ghiorsea sp.]